MESGQRHHPHRSGGTETYPQNDQPAAGRIIDLRGDQPTLDRRSAERRAYLAVAAYRFKRRGRN